MCLRSAPAAKYPGTADRRTIERAPDVSISLSAVSSPSAITGPSAFTGALSRVTVATAPAACQCTASVVPFIVNRR